MEAIAHKISKKYSTTPFLLFDSISHHFIAQSEVPLAFIWQFPIVRRQNRGFLGNLLLGDAEEDVVQLLASLGRCLEEGRPHFPCLHLSFFSCYLSG